MFQKFGRLNFEFARPVKYRMSYLWFYFYGSFGKVGPLISNRIT